MADTNQRTFLALMLGALIKKAGGEVRVTMEDLESLDPSGAIFPDQDQETGDIILTILDNGEVVPSGTTLQ